VPFNVQAPAQFADLALDCAQCGASPVEAPLVGVVESRRVQTGIELVSAEKSIKTIFY
jgi:hypothetical protein